MDVCIILGLRGVPAVPGGRRGLFPMPLPVQTDRGREVLNYCEKSLFEMI